MKVQLEIGKRTQGDVPARPTIPVQESVGRKFLRMTLAERTKFVELFGDFSSEDWRRFRRWIRKIKEAK